MALTKVNRGGLNTGISDSSNATFLTVDSSEQAVIKSEGGAVTTSVQQGLAKVYGVVNQSSTQSIVGSFNLSGKPLKEKMINVLEKLYNEKVILDHGMEVGKELANVLSGGDTTIDKKLTENDLYKLELDSFMKLIENKKTQDRIKHTLKTGKPLVN